MVTQIILIIVGILVILAGLSVYFLRRPTIDFLGIGDADILEGLTPKDLDLYESGWKVPDTATTQGSLV